MKRFSNRDFSQRALWKILVLAFLEASYHGASVEGGQYFVNFYSVPCIGQRCQVTPYVVKVLDEKGTVPKNML